MYLVFLFCYKSAKLNPICPANVHLINPLSISLLSFMNKLEEKDRSKKPIVYTLHLILATYRSSSFFPFSHTFHPSPLYTLLPISACSPIFYYPFFSAPEEGELTIAATPAPIRAGELIVAGRRRRQLILLRLGELSADEDRACLEA